MAQLQRICARCGRQFAAATSKATYCTGACRIAASKERRKSAPVAPVIQLGSGTVRSAVLRELGEQASTSIGREALMLAERIDSGVSDSAWPSLSRRLDELRVSAAKANAAAAGAASEEDPVEFLKRRAAGRAG